MREQWLRGKPRWYFFPLPSCYGQAAGLRCARNPRSTGCDRMAGCVVRAIMVQPDGKILIGGEFDAVLGATRNRIARLNADGTLDTSFDPNAIAVIVYRHRIQADGKILVGGVFGPYWRAEPRFMARLDPVTGAADSFNPNPDDQSPSPLSVQPDGKILVGGDFLGIGGRARHYIARLDPITGRPIPSIRTSALEIISENRRHSGTARWKDPDRWLFYQCRRTGAQEPGSVERRWHAR